MAIPLLDGLGIPWPALAFDGTCPSRVMLTVLATVLATGRVLLTVLERQQDGRSIQPAKGGPKPRSQNRPPGGRDCDRAIASGVCRSRDLPLCRKIFLTPIPATSQEFPLAPGKISFSAQQAGHRAYAGLNQPRRDYEYQ